MCYNGHSNKEIITQLVETKQLTPITIPSIPGLVIGSTGDNLTPATRLAQLIWAPSGFGKTNLAGSLDALCQKYESKRCLYIPVEVGEGGGSATIRSLGIPMIVPTDFDNLMRILALLKNDKSVGGVVLDSGSEVGKVHVKNAALKYPCRENVATRAAKVATRSDYQVMGELQSQVLRAMLELTTHKDPAYRKHIVVTASDVTREEDEKVVFIGPDFPGRMRNEAPQLFQQVGSIYIRTAVVDGKRTSIRTLTFRGDGVKIMKDRYEMFPPEITLRRTPKDEGEDYLTMWEKWWLPAVAAAQGKGVSV